jgi:hypothetical protein
MSTLRETISLWESYIRCLAPEFDRLTEGRGNIDGGSRSSSSGRSATSSILPIQHIANTAPVMNGRLFEGIIDPGPQLCIAGKR